MTESEIWKDVVGFEGFYKVSNKGNVHSVSRKNALGKNREGRMLKPIYDKDGYIRVNLCKKGKQKTRLIHRLVLEAFVPNPNGYPEVNHRDEVKTNNHVENLEWCTREYNMNYGTTTIRVGQKLSKKVKAVNVETGEVITFNSATEAMNKGYFDASRACRGIYCTSGHLYKGYRWSYWEEK